MHTHPTLSRVNASFVLVAAIAVAVSACADAPPTAPGADRARSLEGPAYAGARGEPRYTISTFNVPGAVLTSPQGINSDGAIAGIYRTSDGRLHGFILQDGGFTTVDHPGADHTEVRGIGPNGEVVGNYWSNGEVRPASHEDPNPFPRHGFLRTADGRFSPVRAPNHENEILQRILPDGTILGCGHNRDLMASMQGITLARQAPITRDAFASMDNGGTPDGRRIVGLYTDMDDDLQKGYVIEDGVFAPFMVPGSNLTQAWDVNPRGDVVGLYRTGTAFRGFVWTGDGFTTIHVDGATATRAFAINARGDVVGAYVAGGVTRGFLARRTP